MSSLHPQLAAHVRACHVGDQMIFLDLLRNRYVGIGGPNLAALSRVLLDTHGTATALDPASLVDWTQRLKDRHLLSDAGPERWSPQMRCLPEPVTSAAHDDTPLTAADWQPLLSLWWATRTSAALLRRRSLAEITERVIALRARHRRGASDTAQEALHNAAATYMRLRPFSLSSHDRCLNDSLTLIHFLAARDLFPSWVIGVRVHPFGAHSWVQSGEVVLNDLPERVRRYRPILIV